MGRKESNQTNKISSLTSNVQWCVSYFHKYGVQQHFFTPPPIPGALGRGQKAISFKFNYIEAIIKLYMGNFHSVAWIMLQEWNLGVLGWSNTLLQNFAMALTNDCAF